jgi:hypothetical protein
MLVTSREMFYPKLEVPLEGRAREKGERDRISKRKKILNIFSLTLVETNTNLIGCR